MSVLESLYLYLNESNLNWLLVPREDEFLGEYVPLHNERLCWATSFSGSAGIAVIGHGNGHLFVDGRYTLQAKKEAIGLEIHDLKDFWEWLSSSLKPTDVIGLNLRLHTQGFLTKLQEIPSKIQHIDPHPVDQLWDDRPSFPMSKLISHPLNYAGENYESKLERIIATLSDEVDALYVQDPHDVAWVLNLRGQDLAYTPIALCRALIWKSGKVDLFVSHSEVVSQDIRMYLGDRVSIHAMNRLEELLTSACVQIDSAVSAYHRQLVGTKGVVKASPITLMKAIKNPIEIEGMRKAHQWDGEALCKFRSWLLEQDPATVDELTAADRLEAFRRECPSYKGPSFPTISAFGANGAIVHYRATSASNQKFQKQGLYLVDSGGQYLEGTTDVTRVFAIGTPTIEQREMYTRVLKGHLRLTSAIFLKGTTGHQLDVLARYDLWQRGLNYEHGTGHGVGSYLSVHEGPQGISPRMNATPLQVGMVVSNEPGYYKTSEFGIRIENMMVVQESKYEGYLCFETLTQVPYEKDLIDDALLNDEELNYLSTLSI